MGWKKIICVFFVLTVIVSIVSTQSVPPNEIDFPQIGTWEVTGRDSRNWVAYLVIKNKAGVTFSGYFDWYYSPENDFVGKEYFSGEFIPQSKMVTIKGSRVTDPSRLGLGTYVANVSNSIDFISGTWIGGGKWEAKKMAGNIKPPEITDFEGNWVAPYGQMVYKFRGNTFEYTDENTSRIKGTFSCTENHIAFNTTHELSGFYDPIWEPFSDPFETWGHFGNNNPVPYSFSYANISSVTINGIYFRKF